MNSYIALLRGINVSGKKKIKMSDLKEFLLNDGFIDVQTYIQSGNVIFNSKKTDKVKLAEEISLCILKNYAFEVPVVVKSKIEWERILNKNPFINQNGVDLKKLYVTFLYNSPSKEDVEILKTIDFNPDKYQIKNDIVYSCYGQSFGKTKMTNNVFEKKLKLIATTRNWNTVNKLLQLVS
ncbi:DUF1697 domain-containing protein [Urechidicola croceus]|uniref:DUF1697 domain-containing protein n=1 Tax=Urechidicola croceus TaxID=1850246 RepID=A0A1D8P580_9FLAO|nr:DUF1697 domain-containing protein [Urechidicola croceus]AOW19720.1 hypothetical protein LPB138_03060 [Urechidicola croceus]